MTKQERFEKLEEILRKLYIHATNYDDYGCKECEEFTSQILSLFTVKLPPYRKRNRPDYLEYDKGCNDTIDKVLELNKEE